MITVITKTLAKDFLAKAVKKSESHLHRDAAINWLKRAHDSTPDGGVGYGYYLRGNPFTEFGLGWRPSYVETSGYITETFYDIAQSYNDNDALARAERIGRWLMTVQNKDGSFSNTNISNEDGIVFDTGQVLFGLVRCYKETKDTAFKLAAEKAVNWLVSKLSEDGAWRLNTHLNVPHAYNARTAWAMLEYCKIFPTQSVAEAARKNLDWVLKQQTALGLFENCAFEPGKSPFIHTIAYTIRGLFEGGLLMKDDAILKAAYKAAEAVRAYVDETGFLAGQISITGDLNESYSCLTGNCQMVIIWLKMGRLYNNQAMIKTAELALDYVLSVHDIKTSHKNIHGALKGSHPVWGRYTPFAYPNWATKFLIEALMLQALGEV